MNSLREMAKCSTVPAVPPIREGEGETDLEARLKAIGCEGMWNCDCRCESCEESRKSKLVYPGGWLRFHNADDFRDYYGQQCPLPEVCIGLEDSDFQSDHEAVLDTLSCGCKPADHADAFYYHRTLHIARCRDCQEAEWIAQGFEVVNGFPYGDRRATSAERLKERDQHALETLAQWEKQQQEKLIAEAKALFNATEV